MKHRGYFDKILKIFNGIAAMDDIAFVILLYKGQPGAGIISLLLSCRNCRHCLEKVLLDNCFQLREIERRMPVARLATKCCEEMMKILERPNFAGSQEQFTRMYDCRNAVGKLELTYKKIISM